MDSVLVRYADIGSKSSYVRSNMTSILRQRVQDRLQYEELDFDRVSKIHGRILVKAEEAEEIAEVVSEIPGVASCSPAIQNDAEIDSIKEAVKELEVGETFGVRANRTGEHEFTSRKLEQEIGSFVDDREDASVDLENPDTWVRIDVRSDEAFVFQEKLEGPAGFPVGSQETLAALVSGGIDSPVAAYQVMKRGSDILPIYFYNKPIAAEDHLIRFKAVIEKLKRFHPSKKWEVYIVDMEEVNEELMEVERGRMILHRMIMFRTAEKIAEKEGLSGLVTGESLGQKSSQTASNLEITSSQVKKPVHRPLLSLNKQEIVNKAQEIGTFEEAEINSACSTLAPDNPATSIKDEDIQELMGKVGIKKLVDQAFEAVEKIKL